MNRTIIALVVGILIVVAIIINNQKASKPKETVVESTMQKGAKLKVEDIKEGGGETVKKGDTVVIHYVGTLESGEKFDSSVDRGTPFETQIGVGNVIQGWDEGVIGMKVGGKRKLTIPPNMGYGDQAAGSIPPSSTLIFELELLEIK